jgi:hypothetical protein
MTEVLGHQSCIGRIEDHSNTTNVPQSGTVGGEMMKSIMKGAIRDEKGSVLIMVLILLVVGGLILTPLLGLMSTGLLAGQVYEKKMDEYYAADAGVEDAIWRIQSNNLTFDANNCSEPWQITVNDRSVEVVVYREDLDPTPCGEDFTYQILSTAATDDGGGTAAIDSSTTIDAHIMTTPQFYPSIMDQLITIQQDIVDDKQLEDDLGKLNVTCPENCMDCTVCGQAYDYYEEYDEVPVDCRGCVAVYNFPSVAWPSAGSLISMYWQDVENAVPYYTSQSLDVQDYPDGVGPLFWNRAGTVKIENEGSDGLTLRLNGTVYAIGDTIIGQSGDKEFTVDLNGHTIFVSSNSSSTTGSNALIVGGKCTVQGPGLIVAVGDIKFAPKAVIGGEDEPIFVFSVDGTATVQPSGTWWGAIAGKEYVEVKKGNDPITTYPTDGFGDLAFPRTIAGWTYSVASWEINPQ